MVTRLVLLIILGFVAALYFPDSRQMMVDNAMPVLQPVLMWNAEREMEELSRSVRREARDTYQLPQDRGWEAFVMANFSADAATDPWGKPYAYRSFKDSFSIRSYGPDGEIGSVDDLHLIKRRPF